MLINKLLSFWKRLKHKSKSNGLHNHDENNIPQSECQGCIEDEWWRAIR